MKHRYQISDIPSLTGRSIFFDANILIYIFWPTGSPRWVKNYSKIFNRLIKQKNKMVVDFLVISEFINRALRLTYNIYIKENKLNPKKFKFKTFRDSQEGENASNDIYGIVNQNILKKFDIAGKIFTKSDIQNFLIVDSLDFLDKGIVSICRENNFVLLTNDKDFAPIDLEILTSNRKLSKI